jgi:hypothetical protein
VIGGVLVAGRRRIVPLPADLDRGRGVLSGTFRGEGVTYGEVFAGTVGFGFGLLAVGWGCIAVIRVFWKATGR